MKSTRPILLAVLVTTSVVLGQTNDAALFRISSSHNTWITDFDAVAGTISWSNGVAGVTNQLQRSTDLTATNGWADFVMLVSTGGFAGTERIIDLDPPEGMVLIPGGMNCGTNPLAPGESYDLYYPSNAYTLRVTAFYMDQYEVTKAQWDAVYNWAISNNYSFDNVGSGKALDHPVQTVNWYDCVKWCNARSEMEGRIPFYTVGTNIYKTGQGEPDCDSTANGYRLPDSDEWEYAARGGVRNSRFPWGDTISHHQANYKGGVYTNSYDESIGYHPAYNDGASPYTSPAGSFFANGYGLFNMAGNVYEWCYDWYPGYEGMFRHVGGSSWANDSKFCRLGSRAGNFPDIAWNSMGFRTVRSALEPE